MAEMSGSSKSETVLNHAAWNSWKSVARKSPFLVRNTSRTARKKQHVPKLPQHAASIHSLRKPSSRRAAFMPSIPVDTSEFEDDDITKRPPKRRKVEIPQLLHKIERPICSKPTESVQNWVQRPFCSGWAERILQKSTDNAAPRLLKVDVLGIIRGNISPAQRVRASAFSTICRCTIAIYHIYDAGDGKPNHRELVRDSREVTLQTHRDQHDDLITVIKEPHSFLFPVEKLLVKCRNGEPLVLRPSLFPCSSITAI